MAANRVGGKFCRPTGRRLPVFGAEAAAVMCVRARAYAGAIIIHCRLSVAITAADRRRRRSRPPLSDAGPAAIPITIQRVRDYTV